MRQMTESNLLAAFAGESQAHIKYAIFAERAHKEGLPNIARLFEAISFAERVHATNHLRELGLIQSTVNNLQAAIDGENHEIDEMYPVFQNTAEFQGEKGAVRSITRALEAEKIHAAMYSDAQAIVKSGKDLEIGAVHICQVCGYTVADNAPDQCPVCGAPKNQFRAF